MITVTLDELITRAAVQIELPEAERDYAHAEILAGYFSNRFRWATHRRRWMEFQQGVWRPVEVEYVARLASETLRQHYAVEAGGTSDKAKMAELGKKLTEACTYARIEGALSFLKGFDDILTRPEQWDAWPWLLNVRNGTLDLRTGTFRVHAPEDLLTKQAAVDYDPQAQAPNWEKHLSYFLPNANVRREVQRELGTALVGAVLDEVLPIWYGTGANGKSTTARIVMALLGDYAKRAAPNLLVKKRFEEHPTGIADLAGARLVFSLETDDGKRLAEALVKELTGGDVKKARYLYGDFSEFQQTFSLFLVTNHKPQITGADPGIWRRIRLIPWEVMIPDSEKKPQDEVVSALLFPSSLAPRLFQTTAGACNEHNTQDIQHSARPGLRKKDASCHKAPPGSGILPSLLHKLAHGLDHFFEVQRIDLRILGSL